MLPLLEVVAAKEVVLGLVVVQGAVHLVVVVPVLGLVVVLLVSAQGPELALVGVDCCQLLAGLRLRCLGCLGP